jgi:short-subunit dehydrogenase
LPGYVQTEGFDASSVPGAYWISTAHDAALQIIDAINAKQKQVFISHRWWIIGWLMNHLPDWLYFDIIGGL